MFRCTKTEVWISKVLGKRRGALERGLRPLERGPVSSSSFAFLDILRKGHFGDEIWTTLGLILSCFSSGFLTLLSLYLSPFFFFDFSLTLPCSLILVSFNPKFLALRLLESDMLYHKMSPDALPLQSLWFRISDPWFLLKSGGFIRIYLL